MVDIILKKLFGKGFEEFEVFFIIYNYINFKDNIIRKGSILVYEGEKVLILFNMRDGSIIVIGKGNLDWNYLVLYGVGCIMSRIKVKEKVNLEEFKVLMKGIFIILVIEVIIDEVLMVYKFKEEIL